MQNLRMVGVSVVGSVVRAGFGGAGTRLCVDMSFLVVAGAFSFADGNIAAQRFNIDAATFPE